MIKLWKKANNLFQPPVIFADSSIERKIAVSWRAAADIAKGKKNETARKIFSEKTRLFV